MEQTASNLQPAAKPTLEYALRPHAVPRDELVRRYKPVMMMVRQILGVVPHAMSYFEIWPPAFTTYSVLVPSLLDIPRCDLGRGISPDLRSLVLYVASRSHGCAYCSAHAAGVGTVFRGPGGSLARNREALNPNTTLFDPAERAAMDYATAVGQLPSEVALEHRLALARNFSPEHEEAVVLAATLMGFLNCAMDTLGMVLEWRVLQQAEEYLSKSQWTPSVNYDERFDKDIVEADKQSDDGQTLGALALARTMAGIIAYDRDALSGIEKRPAKIYAQLEEALGFVPSYIERVERLAPKRVFTHALVERAQLDSGQVPVWLKHAMCFVAAKRCHNRLLAAHYAFMAVRAGAEPTQLAAALEPTQASGPEATAFNLARAVSVAPTRVTEAEIRGLTSHYEPPAIIELIVALGIHGMLQRYTSTYPAAKYEAPIAAFVAEHGELLGLHTSPSKDGPNWDEQAARARGA